MPRLLEEIMEDVLLALRDLASRDIAVRLNTDGPVYLAYSGDIVDVNIDDEFDGSSWSSWVLASDGTAQSYVTLVDTTTGPISLSLPEGLVDNARQPVIVTHVAGDATVNAVTITDAGGATFNGQTSMILETSGASVTLVSRGGSWYVSNLFSG